MMLKTEMTRDDFDRFWGKVKKATPLQISGKGYQVFAIKNDALMASATSRIYSDTCYLGYVVLLDKSLVRFLPDHPEELQKP